MAGPPQRQEKKENAYVRTQDPVLTTALKYLGPESYTAQRLQHATSEHLYLTTRRCFIGPIPEGWLKSHRKEWYRHHLHVERRNKSSSFTAGSNQGRERRLSGLDGPSASAVYRASFSQPQDADDEQEEPYQAQAEAGEDHDQVKNLLPVATAEEVVDPEEGDSDDEATLRTPPATDIPRSAPEGENPELRRESGQQAEEALQSFSTANTVLSPPVAGLEKIPPVNTSHTSSPELISRTTSLSVTSYETASEGMSIIVDEPGPLNNAPSNSDQPGPGYESDTDNDDGIETPRPRPSLDIDPLFSQTSLLFPSGAGPDSTTSHSPLLNPRPPSIEPSRPAGPQTDASDQRTPLNLDGNEDAPANPDPHPPEPTVRFAEPEVMPIKKREMQVRARLAQSATKRLPRRFTRGKLKDGEIVKMEKMLVRIDITSGPEQPGDEYDEKDSQRVETRAVEKWREFMVVCRESQEDDAVLCLEMYKTRVIPASNKEKTKKKPQHRVLLSPQKVRVNLYSALDKTVVLWQPRGARTLICFLRPRTGASAVEWYTFLHSVLGQERTRTLQVNIPDLRVTLRVDNPFATFESAQNLADAAAGDEAAMLRTMQAEQAIAGKIVDGCMAMLANTGEWKDILPKWSENNRVGLAWKRYDRLEWVHGANERKMYGTLAMQRTHELELRPKEHYPTSVNPIAAGGEMMVEPAPVEGFLIRLTSHKGQEQKLGKLFFKRLYFTTYNHHLVFSRPSKAAPPPPPKMPMQESAKIPTAKQIAEKIPLIFAVNPFPVQNNKLSWLDTESPKPEELQAHDRDAFDEAQRNNYALLNSDGFIDLCDVVKIRKMKPGATPADADLESGSDVDFDQSVNDSIHEDGSITEPDHERTFELLMRNGLVVRLQAFSKATRKEWIKRLRALVLYWSIRTSNDLDLFKAVRRQNLATLNIDERAEAHVGQFAQKWEVGQSFASPELYNMCGISCCRCIHRSGTLFRKPRMRDTFSRCRVILCDGHLVVFEETARKSSGKQVAHVHHRRVACIDLRDCYLYSGLVTENDLLYQNRTFDNSMPGNHALPRLYVEDGWTSADEDAMTTFVVWQPRKKSWFRGVAGLTEEQDDVVEARRQGERDKKRAEGKGKVERRLKRVSQLGVPGRSVVFKARSRAERDHWVMGIADEIERVGGGEEVRVFGGDGSK